jgi:hypothetical protein
VGVIRIIGYFGELKLMGFFQWVSCQKRRKKAVGENPEQKMIAKLKKYNQSTPTLENPENFSSVVFKMIINPD